MAVALWGEAVSALGRGSQSKARRHDGDMNSKAQRRRQLGGPPNGNGVPASPVPAVEVDVEAVSTHLVRTPCRGLVDHERMELRQRCGEVADDVVQHLLDGSTAGSGAMQ